MPVKPMLIRVFSFAKVISAHGFTGHTLTKPPTAVVFSPVNFFQDFNV